jgi:hypothetical protein
MYTCSVNSKAKKVKKNQDAILTKLNSIDSTLKATNTKVVDRPTLEALLTIQGLEVSKNVVYDNNTIVRSKTRPDDVMAKYQKEIDKLRNENK